MFSVIETCFIITEMLQFVIHTHRGEEKGGERLLSALVVRSQFHHHSLCTFKKHGCVTVTYA